MCPPPRLLNLRFRTISAPWRSIIPLCESLERRSLLSAVFDSAFSIASGVDVRANGVAIDSAGNTYYTGFFAGSVDLDPGPGTFTLSTPATYDFMRPDSAFVSKIDAGGKFAWATEIADLPDNVLSNDIAITPDGDIFVAGYMGTEPDHNASIFISKLDKSGKLLWTITPQPAPTGGSIVSIAADSKGNLIVVGNFTGDLDFNHDGTPDLHSDAPDGLSDTLIAKIDGNGRLIWVKDTGEHPMKINAVTVDPSGNIYTTGRFAGDLDFDPGPGTFNLTGGIGSAFIQKLDQSGNFLWAKMFSGASSDYAEGNDITSDAAGNVYSTGYFAGIIDFDPGENAFRLDSAGNAIYSSDSDVYISKLDRDGNFGWTTAVADGETFSSAVPQIALGADRSLYIYAGFTGTGNFDVGPGACGNILSAQNGAFLLELNTSGQYLSAQQIEGTAALAAADIAANPRGDISLAGYFFGEMDAQPGPGTHPLTHSAGWIDAYLIRLHQQRAGSHLSSTSTANPTRATELRSLIKNVRALKLNPKSTRALSKHLTSAAIHLKSGHLNRARRALALFSQGANKLHLPPSIVDRAKALLANSK